MRRPRCAPLPCGAAALLCAARIAAAASPPMAKWVQEMPRPAVFKPSSVDADGTVVYDVEIRQFAQQLHPGLPASQLWGYGGTCFTGPCQSSPGPLFIHREGVPARIRWASALPTTHLFGAADKSIHGLSGLPEVRNVVHVHGISTTSESDGTAMSWYSPGYAARGPRFTSEWHHYPHNQHGMLLYHDHAFGITRSNAYAGLIGGYLIRGKEEEVLINSGVLPSGAYEVPLVFGDKTLAADGSLAFPSHGKWQPESFGDIALVNGAAFPKLTLEAALYRLRVVNGCGDRHLRIMLVDAATGAAGPGFVQIGTEQGLLRTAVRHGVGSRVLISPGERFDMLLDLTGLAGRSFIVHNDAAAPFTTVDDTIAAAAAGQTSNPLPQLMRVDVVACGSTGNATSASARCPTYARLPSILSGPKDVLPACDVQPPGVDAPAYTRRVVEMGMTNGVRTLEGRLHEEPITIRPLLGSTEVWEFVNRMADSHPLHLHLVTFQVLDRTPLVRDAATGACTAAYDLGVRNSHIVPALAHERGPKDTVWAPPCHVTRIAATFDRLGYYLYHCHMLGHEDWAMHRPFEVVAAPVDVR